MRRRHFLSSLAIGSSLTGAPGTAGRSRITSYADTPAHVDKEAVLFAFDDRSWPLIRGGRIVMNNPVKRPEPVLRGGVPGESDEMRATLGGTVLFDRGKFRMWYNGLAFPPPGFAGTPEGKEEISFFCYAESQDGYHWVKPKLGLVEFHGSKDNNILFYAHNGGWAWAILDEQAPPAERYKMAIEGFPPDVHFNPAWQGIREGLVLLFVSPDGIHWSPGDGVGLRSPLSWWFETGTLYQFQGYYHVGGHGHYSNLPKRDGSEPAADLPVRVMTMARSRDFRKWPDGGCQRVFFSTVNGNSGRPWDGRECHLGPTVLSRGNVCLGNFSYFWDPSAAKNQRPGPPDEVRWDLGFAISNDGLHFREPAPGHIWMKHDIEELWDPGLKKKPNEGVLMYQTQGILNYKDETRIYYGASTKGGNTYRANGHVGLATLPRDRFGRLQQVDKFSEVNAFSCVLETRAACALFLNTEGVSPTAPLTVAVWDEFRTEIQAGYSHEDCVPLTTPGLRTKASWKKRGTLPINKKFVLELHYSEPAHFYAAYVGTTES